MSNCKRATVGILRSAILLACFTLSIYTSALAGLENIDIYPYAQNVRAEGTGASAVIMWRTYNKVISKVEYHALGSTSPWLINAIFTPVHQHEVKLSGLEKGKVYEYRVYDGDLVVTDERTFTTPVDSKQPFKFAVYSDSHNLHALHQKAGLSIFNLNPNFVLNLGDTTEDAMAEEFMYFLKDVQSTYLKKAPLWPVYGNHEKSVGTGLNAFFSLFFSLPAPESYYSFDYGNVHFVGLNTSNMSDTYQKTWLMADLAAFNRDPKNLNKWLIVYMHIPAYSAGGHYTEYDEKYVQANWAPIFEANGVDLVFSGHDHFYERIKLENATYIITALGANCAQKISPWYLQKHLDEGTFCLINIRNSVDAQGNLASSHLDLTAYNSNTSAPLDNLQLSKGTISADISTPKTEDFVSGQVQIIGKASAVSGFQRYELSYSRLESPSSVTVIKSSTVPVANGVLGTWNTTALANGKYLFKLKVVSSQQTATTSVVLNIGNPLYKFVNKTSGAYFYTANESEKNNLINLYSNVFEFQGVACGVSLVQKTGMVPLYRFWNKTNGAHFYTANEAEKNNLIINYSRIFQYELIAAWVYPPTAPAKGSVPLYRFWNAAKNYHFYTASEVEKTRMLSWPHNSAFTYEGIACYVYPPAAD